MVGWENKVGGWGGSFTTKILTASINSKIFPKITKLSPKNNEIFKLSNLPQKMMNSPMIPGLRTSYFLNQPTHSP